MTGVYLFCEAIWGGILFRKYNKFLSDGRNVFVVPSVSNELHNDICECCRLAVKENNKKAGVLITNDLELLKDFEGNAGKEKKSILISDKEMKHILQFMRTKVDQMGNLILPGVYVIALDFPVDRLYGPLVASGLYQQKEYLWRRIFHCHNVSAPAIKTLE